VKLVHLNCPLTYRSSNSLDQQGEAKKLRPLVFNVIASPSHLVILSIAKNLILLRAGSAKQSPPLHTLRVSPIYLNYITRIFSHRAFGEQIRKSPAVLAAGLFEVQKFLRADPLFWGAATGVGAGRATARKIARCEDAVVPKSPLPLDITLEIYGHIDGAIDRVGK